MWEDAVARLEESLYFQERFAEELNSALAAQQRQLDLMQRQMAIMQGRMEEMQLLLETGGIANVPPPHYQM